MNFNDMKYPIGTIYYNSKNNFSMSVLTAFDANRISIEKSSIKEEFNKIQTYIKSKTEEGLLALEVSSPLNGVTIDTLQQLGFKCFMNVELGTWTISWREPEKASIAMQEEPSFHFLNLNNKT